jgi:tetratricopeptide (TPR) repeat protein
MEGYRGKDDEKFFYSQNRLGDAMRISGKEREAETLLRKAEQELRKRFPNSLLLADCSDILGELYYYISDVERAGNYFRESLAIKKRLLKSNDARLALSLSNMGRYYNFKQRHDLAFQYTTRAYQILEKNPTHFSEIVPEMIYCEHAYSIKETRGVDNEKDFNKKVRPVLMHAIERNRKLYKADNFWLAYLHHYLGNTYTDQLGWTSLINEEGIPTEGVYKKALSHYLEAERIYKKFLPNNNPRLSMTYYVMGLVRGLL